MRPNQTAQKPRGPLESLVIVGPIDLSHVAHDPGNELLPTFVPATD